MTVTAVKMMMMMMMMVFVTGVASLSIEQTELTVTHLTSSTDLPPLVATAARKLQASTGHLTFYNLYPWAAGLCWVWASCDSCAKSTPVETFYGDVKLVDFDASSYGADIYMWIYGATGSPTPCSGVTSGTPLLETTYELHQDGVNIFGVGLGNGGGASTNIHRNPDALGNHTMWFVNDYHDYPTCDFFAYDTAKTEYSIIGDMEPNGVARGTPYECSTYADLAEFGVRCGTDEALWPIDLTKICGDSSFEVVAHGNYSDPAYPLGLTYVPGKKCAYADSCAAYFGGATPSPTPYQGGAPTPYPTTYVVTPAPTVYVKDKNCTDEGTDETLNWCQAYITKYGGAITLG
eukprot:CAMPEP_0198656640 /NCGR_PEP_ID=MMETSP1467-20131203/10397_1 /TAXON_ID=1462469 /ORGANISM="unid. sp., Strain CCMP2135" /LENGTH=347 /DNA_ID=CAMNT_0044392693 /DNA_START=62 /DNA_END=1105 /DNA_ORIENTATION=+